MASSAPAGPGMNSRSIFVTASLVPFRLAEPPGVPALQSEVIGVQALFFSVYQVSTSGYLCKLCDTSPRRQGTPPSVPLVVVIPRGFEPLRIWAQGRKAPRTRSYVSLRQT
jgi:hypothetical protein